MAKSLTHTKWMCKYDIVFTPKYRRKIIFSKYKESVREIIRDLCKWKGVEIIEGHVCVAISLNPTEDGSIEFYGVSEREECNDDV